MLCIVYSMAGFVNSVLCIVYSLLFTAYVHCVLQVSQNWFGEKERGLATGVLAMSLPLGN